MVDTVMSVEPIKAPLVGRLADQAAARALSRAVAFCFAMIALGQTLFVAFILAFYYPSTLSGDFAAWDKKPLIEGFVANDLAGNLFFGAHVLLAAVVTVGGLVQLVPKIRRRWPAIHRWNGRLYMLTVLALALGGLWLVWVRGTYMNLLGAAGISLNGLLIALCAGMAWSLARRRRYAQHRRWALRLFVLAGAVWFMRVGYMAWGIASGGMGIGGAMDGPFDYFLAFGNSLVPLAVLEIYLRVQERGSALSRYFTAAGLTLSGLLIAAGSAGAWLMMWSPYL